MNPADASDRERLSAALNHCYEELAPFRRTRRELIEEYAGSRYGQSILGPEKPTTFVNLIQDLVKAQKTALAYNDPRFLVTAKRGEQESFGARFQTALNTYVKKIHFGDTLRDIIGDAIFQVGIGKVYLADSPEVYHENDIWMDPGMPYLGRVSLDDFCYDVSKDDLRKCQFIANRYTMDYETALACPYFDAEVRKDLEPSKWDQREGRWERASSIASNGDHTDAEIEDVVDLIDVYLPKERLVCTWPVYGKFEIMSTRPLAVLPWDGPETGPYRFLSLIDVPDNIMPTSPAQSLYALFYLYNFLMRRIADRAMRAKTVISYEAGAGEDVARLKDARDMELVKVNRTKAMEVQQFPGPDQGLVNFALGIHELFNRAGGNLESMLGTGPSAATVGQEEMIDQRVGAQLAESRKKVNRFVSECGQDIGWLLFDDPMQVIPGERQIPGTDYTVNADWAPPDILPRHGTFADYGIEVEPYSMEYKSPQQRLGQAFSIMGQLAPLMPMAQQQGLEFQFDAFLKDVAELAGEPRLTQWFRSAPPPMTEPGQMPGVRPPGTGQYTRTNISQGPTSAGRLTMLTQQQPQQPIMSGGAMQ